MGHWAKECKNSPNSYVRSKSEATRTNPGSSGSVKSGFFSAYKEKDASVLWAGEIVPEVLILGYFLRKKASPSFVGLIIDLEFGVVDTAAQFGLIGEGALVRLLFILGARDLQMVWLDKKAQARGVGGETKVVGIALMPLGIAGVCGVLECTVVRDEVPLLLPIKLLRDLEASVDLKSNNLILQKFDVRIPMKVMPFGHATVSVTDLSRWLATPQRGCC